LQDRGLMRPSPERTEARSPNRWNFPRFCKPDTGRKLRISYPQWNFGGLEVSRWRGAGGIASERLVWCKEEGQGGDL
jgi:hypothetical protein